MKRGLAIFDLDGTLFRADAVTVPAVQEAFRERGLPAPAEAEIRRFIGRPTPELHAWLGSLCPEGAAIAEAVDRKELELVAEAGELYPGVTRALEEVRAEARSMAICTNGPRPYVEAVLRACRLGPFFDLVLDLESGCGLKAGMVERALAAFGRPAVVVGDRPEDVEAAHANGLPAVGVTYGIGAAEDLSAAEWLADSARELPALVRCALDGCRGV